jgi:hypothetical protein
LTKVRVCGSREYEDKSAVWTALDKIWETDGDDLIIIQGGATGADYLAKQWAIDHQVPVYHFPARWRKYGKKAGMRRNREMLERAEPDLVLGFPHPTKDSIGTHAMMAIARRAGVLTIDVTQLIKDNEVFTMPQQL